MIVKMNESKMFIVEVFKDIFADLGSRAIRKLVWAFVLGDPIFSYVLLRIDFLQLSKTKGNMMAFIAYLFMGFGIVAFCATINGTNNISDKPFGLSFILNSKRLSSKDHFLLRLIALI